LWVYLSSCLYEETEIADYQAAHDISKPLANLIPAQQSRVLTEICRLVKLASQPAQSSRSVSEQIPPQRARLQKDIPKRERRIAQQQAVIDDPQAAEQRVQQNKAPRDLVGPGHGVIQTCFVIMGFGTKTDYTKGKTFNLDKTYRNIVKPAALAAGLECL